MAREKAGHAKSVEELWLAGPHTGSEWEDEMDLGLQGRRALVTGSSSGIGEGIAKALAKEGVNLIIHGRKQDRAENVARQVRELGVEADIVIADINQPDQVERLGTEALALGDIDILINCAGAGFSRRWFETPMERWREQMEHSLFYAVKLIQMLVPPMRERGWGRILNVSSAAGFKTTPYGPEYSAAKLALQTVSGSLAAELASEGITANTLTAGLVMTENTLGVIAERGAALGWSETGDALEKRVCEELWQVPFGRGAKVEEMADAAVFLVSQRASYVSGTSLRVDGAASGFVH